MEIKIDIQDQELHKILKAFEEATSHAISFEMENRLPHAGAVEFGSGIYNEEGGIKTKITPKNAKKLIVPILDTYLRKISFNLNILNKAIENGKKYPGIMAKFSGLPGLRGFLFLDSTKGQKPQRPVRNAAKHLETWLLNEFYDWFSLHYNDPKAFMTCIKNVGERWYFEIVKETPVLTEKLKTGWRITKGL